MLASLKMEKYAESVRVPLMLFKSVLIFSPEGITKKIMIARLFYIILLCFILANTFIQFPYSKHDILKNAANLEGVSSFGQHLGKTLVLIYQSKNLTGLIENLSKFWSIDKCTEIVRKRLDKLYKSNISLQKLFFASIVACVTAMLLSPLFGRDLPIGLWSLEGYDWLHKMTLIAQTITLPAMGIFLVAFDCIFLAFCVEIIVQFQILCECFKNLDVPKASWVDGEEFEERQYELIKTYIQHHVYLLKVLKDLQDVYSPAILVEYASITPIICAYMYAMLESNYVILLSREGVLCFTAVLQLAFYCISADYATSESLTVGDAIFTSNWYSNSTFKKYIPFIIQRSQRPFLFTAGRLFTVNSRTLLTGLKVSWSLCTVMRAIKQKS